MAEAKSRRELSPRPRTRVKADPAANGEVSGEEESAGRAPRLLPPEPTPPAPVIEEANRPEPPRPETPRQEAPRQDPRPEAPRPRSREEDDYSSFDEEINNRYEEIKRGSTHIS